MNDNKNTKYFSEDTVKIALDLFKKLKLIYMEEDGYLQLANYKNIVGSETYGAKRKRVQREKTNKLGTGVEIDGTEYAKKVLETYKQRKLFTMELLLSYENKKAEPLFLPKNIPKKQFVFMDDYHS